VRALTHGGTARKATLLAAGSWAERIYAQLAREAPLRDGSGELPAHDRQLVELLAGCLARLQAVTAWLEHRPPVDEKGEPLPALETERRLRREAAGYLDSLGMSAAARAKLGVDLIRTRDHVLEWSAETDREQGR